MDHSSSGRAPFRCGYVAIIGAPNVGKSTLMNTLLKQKISIVTPKPQTTRHRVLGILSSESSQFIFLDTPGIIAPRYALQESMMSASSSAIADADVLVLLVDAKRRDPLEDDHLSLTCLDGVQKPVLLVINKIDLVPKHDLLPVIEGYARLHPFTAIIPVSALLSDGVDRIVPALLPLLPEHPPYFPLDIVSEQHQRFFVAELIREQIFLRAREEIPYATTVEITEFSEREEGRWLIRAEIYVERDSQKGILIGKGGATLRQLGSAARREIERFLEHPVYLDLRVRVREKWRSDETWLKRFGYGQDHSP
jgi:GTP-binding protein Era